MKGFQKFCTNGSNDVEPVWEIEINSLSSQSIPKVLVHPDTYETRSKTRIRTPVCPISSHIKT